MRRFVGGDVKSLSACLNNRQQSHFWSFVEDLFVFFCRLSRTCRPSGAWCTGLWAFLYTYRPSGAFKGRCEVRTLQNVLFKQALNLINICRFNEHGIVLIL